MVAACFCPGYRPVVSAIIVKVERTDERERRAKYTKYAAILFSSALRALPFYREL